MQVPPLPSTESLQPESAASLVLFQPESFLAAPPVTLRMTSVTAAVELPEGCTSGHLGFRRRGHRELSSAASAQVEATRREASGFDPEPYYDTSAFIAAMCSVVNKSLMSGAKKIEDKVTVMPRQQSGKLGCW
ncbi:hypothetical protein MTO96_016137 [Rhipicephalus appendiculatus]